VLLCIGFLVSRVVLECACFDSTLKVLHYNHQIVLFMYLVLSQCVGMVEGSLLLMFFKLTNSSLADLRPLTGHPCKNVCQ
jgi:hypothetical protein